MATAQLRTRDDVPLSRAGRTAVILNANAKRVGPRVRRRVLDAAPNADVFFTESLEQADFVTRRVLDSGYETIVTGGGDGTVVNTIGRILAHREAGGHSHCPRFAVLKLGTGNAIADFLGSGDYAEDLRRIDDADARPLHMLRIGGERSTFGGLGWDAFILNNYERMKAQAERFAVTRSLFKTVAGYLVAGIGKSVPELLLQRPSWNVRVVNTGGIAFRLDNVTGDVVERYAPGAVVHQGPMRMACFGTTPYYGFKLKVMPYADRTPGMFHLRLIDMHPLAAVARLRRAWKGELHHPGVTDLQLSACRLEFDGPAPFQIAGDGAGETQSLEIEVDDPVDVVRFA